MKILKFEAEWCSPCKSLATIMEDLTFPCPIEVINIDEDQETPQKYGVRGVPTLILLDDNNSVLKTLVGSQSKMDLINELDAKQNPSVESDGYH